MNKYDEISCPKCLKANNVKDLEETTEYGCWSGEETTVQCLHCDHYFEVQCEHQGYMASTDSFDMNEFRKVHGVKIPDKMSWVWVNHYFKDLIVDGYATMYVPPAPYENQRDDCREAYHFVMKEWARIQASLKGEEDASESEETA